MQATDILLVEYLNIVFGSYLLNAQPAVRLDVRDRQLVVRLVLVYLSGANLNLLVKTLLFQFGGVLQNYAPSVPLFNIEALLLSMILIRGSLLLLVSFLFWNC